MNDKTLRRQDAGGLILLVVASNHFPRSPLASALTFLNNSFSFIDSKTHPADLHKLLPPRIILLADSVFSCHADQYRRDLDWAFYFRNIHPESFLLLAVDNRTDVSICAHAIEAGINGFVNVDVPDFPTLLADRIEETLLRFQSSGFCRNSCDVSWMTSVMGIPARSQSMQELVFRACQAALLDYPILIEADHAEGSFQLAQAIHKMDPKRSTCPFFAIGVDTGEDVSSDQRDLFYNTGAFSNKIEDYLHRLIFMEGGTLVLENPCRLALDVQEKVYDTLRKKGCLMEPSASAGGGKVRVITLASEPLLPKVRKGRFHRELCQCLSRIELRFPPLCERRDDVPLLVNHYIQKYAKTYGCVINAIAPEIYPILQTFAERKGLSGLENVIRTSLLAKNNGTTFTAADLSGVSGSP